MANTTLRIIAIIVAVLVLLGLAYLIARKDSDESDTPVLSVSAFNQTKNGDVGSTTTQPGDVIVFNLTAENKSDKVISGYIVEANISEIIPNAVLLDASGASFNSNTNSLVWTPLDIPAKGSIQKQFSVRVNDVPDANAALRIRFNNELTVAIAKPTVAGTNNPTTPPYVAPATGASLNTILVLSLISTIAYFAIRKYRVI